MRDVVLYIAMSLDGFIADKDGGVAWLEEQASAGGQLVESSYGDFIKTIDTVLLGYTTYRQIATELFPGNWPYRGMQSYVMTHKKLEDLDQITFTDEGIETLVKRLKQQPGKDIWICGGAKVANQLIRADLIDRYWFTIMPVILGEGICLFDKSNRQIDLKTSSVKQYGEMTDLIYERRRK